eukprot:2598266-Alexandrium_andersonii.AAC.1
MPCPCATILPQQVELLAQPFQLVQDEAQRDDAHRRQVALKRLELVGPARAPQRTGPARRSMPPTSTHT